MIWIPIPQHLKLNVSLYISVYTVAFPHKQFTKGQCFINKFDTKAQGRGDVLIFQLHY